MKINTINCCKPQSRSNLNFAGDISERSNKKVLYKHFHEMSNQELSAVSIRNAHRKVANGNKMKMYKAIPSLTAAVVGTSLAIAQPTKLSNKIAVGLGFLASTKIIDKTVNFLTENQDNAPSNKKETFKQVLKNTCTALGVITGAYFAIKTGKKALDKYTPQVSNFIKKEANTVKKEINKTKLAKFNDKVINPFIKKHQKLATVSAEALAVGALIAAPIARDNLLQGISKDFKKEAERNFAKGKAIQAVARQEFDKVDAPEV